MAESAIILVLAIHLGCVHLASAGAVLCAWLAWRDQRATGTLARESGIWLAKSSLLALAIGALLGLLVGWTRAQYEGRSYSVALGCLQYKAWWGVAELGFYIACLSVFLAWWKAGPPRRPIGRAIHLALPVLAGTNLLYHFPPLFAVMEMLVSADPREPEMIDAARFREMVFQGEVLSKTVHFWGASFAVAGVAMMGRGLRLLAAQAKKDHGGTLAIWGARVALAATALQLPLGMWVLVQMPSVAKQSVLGDDLAGSLMLLGSVIASLILLHHLATVAMGDAAPRVILRSIALLLLVVVLMTGTMHRVNKATSIVAGIENHVMYIVANQLKGNIRKKENTT